MLGARISALRRDARMSQSELARCLGVSSSAVGMYEQGRREPSAGRLVEIARIFSVSTDYLLTGVPACPGDSRAFARALSRSLATAQRQNALRRREGAGFAPEELTVLVQALLESP